MAGQFYYLITSLPALNELGSPPPLSGAEYVEMIDESAVAQDLVQVVLLSDDLLQMQSYQSGEIETVSPSVLTVAQVTGDEPLPDYLMAESASSEANSLWKAYFAYAQGVADRYGCEFLDLWLKYEIGMRNALTAARARKLGVEAEEHYIGREYSSGDDFTALVNEWSNAENPMAGMMVLDKSRWNWLSENDSWFKFTYDELVVYAARLLLLKRWDLLSSKAAV
ncbi:MAG: DUF2764 family protein [Sedimentisphaerales bacterium]|nr:DUF2764 family protein [Sedimentisphaerales bacterium]MBN2842161.1 DUF2764 family protein [Sedimentisphaerales bacterium]